MATALPRQIGSALALLAGSWFLAGSATPALAQAKIEVLRIGSSGSMTSDAATKEKSALETLQVFIKDETGMKNEIIRQQNWRVLADKMAKGELHLGVFQGYEFAWAQEQHPELKPLALAVNVYVYPVAYVVTKRDSAVKDFAGLQGQSLAIPASAQPFLRIFVEREAQAAGKKLDEFFSKIETKENVEDVLDDVVDGNLQAAVADRAALEAYKRRKPGRFKQLKSVAQSKPTPSPVIAYHANILDESIRSRFRDGLVRASKTDRGETLLTLFRLTAFAVVPDDFDQVAADTRKTYPPPKND